ncbi:acylneuraminate cytidylyltransferase family protein [Chitinophaga sancti]|uniref:acylneuraminate cytidylyltransferase family protein n=1 Tax=Chitinophaga sancti TaxID=1004 RepID=UPI002A74D993|nr:acylneuraminate cytidylyltransferase family protein [Chitinophaga sancti]WPQ60303.1 acylneuraminate cytidylyltransferase family protein [Chitinophaga sancti]
MPVLVTICARGGSKGVPGKNIKPLGGRPLIDYSIKMAQAFVAKYDGVIALSTDDEGIIRVAAECGITTNYKRPAELASDTAGKVDAIADLLFFEEGQRNKKFEYLLDLDVTSPFRTMEDLETAFQAFKADENALTLFSVSKAGRNPYFNMVEQKENGFFGVVKPAGSGFLSRQASPQVYDINGSFYYYRRSFFDMGTNKVITERSMIYDMPHICFDVDHQIDFDFMEYLVNNGKVGIELL